MTLSLASHRLKTHDYPLLIKRLDQSSITLNLRNGSKEVNDLLRILQVNNRSFLVKNYDKPLENRIFIIFIRPITIKISVGS